MVRLASIRTRLRLKSRAINLDEKQPYYNASPSDTSLPSTPVPSLSIPRLTNVKKGKCSRRDTHGSNKNHHSPGRPQLEESIQYMMIPSKMYANYSILNHIKFCNWLLITVQTVIVNTVDAIKRKLKLSFPLLPKEFTKHSIFDVNMREVTILRCGDFNHIMTRFGQTCRR